MNRLSHTAGIITDNNYGLGWVGYDSIILFFRDCRPKAATSPNASRLLMEIENIIKIFWSRTTHGRSEKSSIMGTF